MTTAVGRRRLVGRRLWVVGGAVVVAAVIVAVVAVGGSTPTSTGAFNRTLAIHMPCRDAGPIRAGGSDWVPSKLAPGEWGTSVAGVLHVNHSDRATFVPDHGQPSLVFIRALPKGLYQFQC